MASNLEFIKYICGQLDLLNSITYRKMFGEYIIYYGEIYFGCIIDNRFMIKITKRGEDLMSECLTDSPYEGGKPMFVIENTEDKEFLCTLVIETCKELPLPKPKKRRM